MTRISRKQTSRGESVEPGRRSTLVEVRDRRPVDAETRANSEASFSPALVAASTESGFTSTERIAAREPRPSAPEPDRDRPPARIVWLKRAVSLWIVFHVAAIVVAPASVAPASRLFQTMWTGFRPYLQACYLNHGYHFFAPQPAESTLLAWSVEGADGAEQRGRIPNRTIQPRLLYHRHFMLTEFLPFPRPEDQQKAWHRAYARHIGLKYKGERVHLKRVTHMLPAPQMVLDGATLYEPAGYREQDLGTYECSEF